MDKHQILLECLEKLESTDMLAFKGKLNRGIPGFSISKSLLENKERFEVVDLMIQHYPKNAEKLMLLILKKMKKMDLVMELKEKLAGPAKKNPKKAKKVAGAKKAVKKPQKTKATKPKAGTSKAAKAKKAAPKKK